MAAIYQWFEGVIAYQTLTTTPYPIEVIEAVEFSISLTGGYLREIEEDQINADFTFLSGDIQDVLISYGPDEDQLDANFTFLSGDIQDILISYGPDEDQLDADFTFLSGDIQDKLVTAFAPDEALEFSISLIDGSLDSV